MKNAQATRTPLIAASLLAADIQYMAHESQDAINAGSDWLHIDVMDGSFVPPITFGGQFVHSLKSSVDVPLDVHLMIERPENHLETFARAGATFITIHQEVSPHLHRTLTAIRGLGCKCGVALNPGTPIESVLPVLDVVDLVLVMTVNPGWGGQPFLPSCVRKIEKLRQEREESHLDFHIEVDGGIQPNTAQLCLAAGADVFVAGTYIFSAKDRKNAILTLRNALSAESITSRIN